MRDTLLGSTQPVLTISLEPGEGVLATTAGFAWMTDSIQMAPAHSGLSAYTARGTAGTIAFAARLPGSILTVQVTPERDYLVQRWAFLAGTPGIKLGAGPPGHDFAVCRVAGHGRAWIELSGDAVRHDLAAGMSLRTHPWHIGMSDASVTVQLAELPEVSDSKAGEARQVAVVSGPGSVWLQSMALLVTSPRTS